MFLEMNIGWNETENRFKLQLSTAVQLKVWCDGRGSVSREWYKHALPTGISPYETERYYSKTKAIPELTRVSDQNNHDLTSNLTRHSNTQAMLYIQPHHSPFRMLFLTRTNYTPSSLRLLTSRRKSNSFSDSTPEDSER
jgi:hypothetical protein